MASERKSESVMSPTVPLLVFSSVVINLVKRLQAFCDCEMRLKTLEPAQISWQIQQPPLSSKPYAICPDYTTQWESNDMIWDYPDSGRRRLICIRNRKQRDVGLTEHS